MEGVVLRSAGPTRKDQMRRIARQHEPTRQRPRRRAVVTGGLLLGVVSLVVLAASGTTTMRANPDDTASSVAPAVIKSDLLPVEASVSKSALDTVEVPVVSGLTLEVATVLLEAAGFVVEVRESGSGEPGGSERRVESQDPPAGTLSAKGESVVVMVAPAGAAGSAASTGKWTVCIDPGHQGASDGSPEPTGPGAKQTKPAMTGGTTGAVTGIAEYEIALQISMNLRRELEERGIRVLMTRTTNDTGITNAERAAVANRARADLFVRVHGNGSPDAAVSGICTLYPAKNRWTNGFAAESRRAAAAIHASTLARTGAADRGTVARGDISGFNWSRVPAVLIECGFLSNRVEDRLLASPHYQEKLADGIADGIVAHLRAEEGR